jgi:hypothetical protein
MLGLAELEQHLPSRLERRVLFEIQSANDWAEPGAAAIVSAAASGSARFIC